VGVELCGHAGIQSDVEVLHLMVEVLAAVGIDQIHIDLGHVGIFRALAAEAGLTTREEMTLFEMLQRKARSEIYEFLSHLHVSQSMRDRLAALIDLNGGEAVLAEAQERLRGGSAELIAALNSLQHIVDELRQRIPGIPLYFDLAELRGYQYQTGIVFAAFVPGHGEEIARGGRYEELGKAFGRARPATGFSTDLKTLMMLSEEPAMPAATVIHAPWCNDPALHELVTRLRGDGHIVVYDLPGQIVETDESVKVREIALRAGKWQLAEEE